MGQVDAGYVIAAYILGFASPMLWMIADGFKQASEMKKRRTPAPSEPTE